MNTMEITKVVGGLAGSLLILLLLKMGAEAYYFPAEAEGEQGYTIATADSGPAEDVAPVPFSELLAAADAGKGGRIFNKCKACHSTDAGVVKVGPSLFGVVDRPQGAEEGFSYSSAVAGLGGTWTPENLNTFLTKPSDYAPGTAMSFAGLPKEKDRANVIAYLATLQ
jgi:cytochrome c